MAKPGPLLRLVHSLERRRAGRAFTIHMQLRRASSSSSSTSSPLGGADASLSTSPPIASARTTAHGGRAFVVGAGDRVDLQVPAHGDPLRGTDTPLLPRHLAVIAVPRVDGVLVRVASLHPERGFHIAPLFGEAFGDVVAQLPPQGGKEWAPVDVAGAAALPAAASSLPASPVDLDQPGVGGALAREGLRLLFDGYTLDIRAQLEPQDLDEDRAEILEVYPLGTQLAFFSGASVRALGDVVSSVTGPGGGGHAIPALVQTTEPADVGGGTLVLRSRSGVHRVEVTEEELRRGLLVGRSRRCVLGRGFDENDGLSRVHAIVLGLDDGVFAFDLASRYGLRDVSRPSRLHHTSRLDDGIGCLVYGAGYLTFEP